MSAFLRYFLLVSSAILGDNLVGSIAALATEVQVVETQISDNVHELAQTTSVSQLSNVQPTDWAFQALQSLIERYGCIVGYSDDTYRGNQDLTRYEFANEP